MWIRDRAATIDAGHWPEFNEHYIKPSSGKDRWGVCSFSRLLGNQYINPHSQISATGYNMNKSYRIAREWTAMLAQLRYSIAPLLVAVIFTSATATMSADEADDQFVVAAGHYDQGRWRFAADEFNKFLQQFPQDPRRNQAVFFLGESLLQLGKHDEARVKFQEYITADPSGDYARSASFRVGESAYLAGKYDLAKTDLADFLKKHHRDPLGAFVLPYLGEIALAGGDTAAAADHFSEALEQYPDGRLQDDCRVGLARALEKQGKPEEAERLYKIVSEKTDSRQAAAARFHLGALYFAAGDNKRALDCFTSFGERFPQSPWCPNAQLGAGLSLLKLDRPTEANEQFDAVLAAETAGAELHQRALSGKIQISLQAKDYDPLDRLAGQFENRYPDSPILGGVRRMKARSLVERKRFAEAVELIEPIAAGKGESPDLESRYLLAVAYRGLGKSVESLEAVSPVAESADGRLKTDAQLLRASLLMSLGKFAEAVAPFEAFLAEKPAGEPEAEALAGLAICRARTKNLDAAKILYAELLEKHPKNPLIAIAAEQLSEAAFAADDAAWAEELSKQLASVGSKNGYDVKGKMGQAWSQYKSGKLAEAADTFDDLLKKEKTIPEDITAEAAFVRGNVLEELGRENIALEMYDLVANRFPKSKQHHDALLAAAHLAGKLNQPRSAAAYYERFAKDYPQSSKIDSALYEWAWILSTLGETDRSEEIFGSIHDRLPGSRFWADASYRAAKAAFDKKDYDRAETIVGQLLKKDADRRVREFALDLRGQLAAARADWPKAREAFSKLIEEFPETERRLVAEYWIAESFYASHDYPAAAAKLDQLAKKIDPREPWTAVVPLRRAQILALQDQWIDAYEVASRIETDFPGFAQQYEADYLLGRCYASRADFESARRMYEKVIASPEGAKTETAAKAQWMIGESFFHQKKHEEAIRAYLRLENLYDYPTLQAASLFQAGKCYELLSETKEAAKLYRRTIDRYSRTNYADEAKVRLGNLGKISGGDDASSS